jgi:hypothetical protein
VSRRRLPRDLQYAINRVAHEYAQLAGTFHYGTDFAKEKARLLALVLTWLAAGDTQEQILAKLQGGRKSAAMRESLKALQQRLRKMR